MTCCINVNFFHIISLKKIRNMILVLCCLYAGVNPRTMYTYFYSLQPPYSPSHSQSENPSLGQELHPVVPTGCLKHNGKESIHVATLSTRTLPAWEDKTFLVWVFHELDVRRVPRPSEPQLKQSPEGVAVWVPTLGLGLFPPISTYKH